MAAIDVKANAGKIKGSDGKIASKDRSLSKPIAAAPAKKRREVAGGKS